MKQGIRHRDRRRTVHGVPAGAATFPASNGDPIMQSPDRPASSVSLPQAIEAEDVAIAELVGTVFEQAPLAERGHLLEPLLRPLGVLSLAAVANGVFAKMRMRGGWQDFKVRVEDVANVRGSDVVALVNYVQQASVDAIDRMGQVLSSSPGLMTSAAAALLAAAIVRWTRVHRRGPFAVRDDGRGT